MEGWFYWSIMAYSRTITLSSFDKGVTIAGVPGEKP